MITNWRRIATIAVACVFPALAMGCAGKATTAAAHEGTTDGTVSIRASNFAFEPSVIRAKAGAPLLLHVVNESGSAHNITVLDIDGGVMRSADIPAGGSADVSLTPPRPGAYKFYCDKPLHPTLGMTGRIVAD